MLQLPLLSLVRTEKEFLPVDVTERAELVGLMARILVTVFQTEGRRTDEQAIMSRCKFRGMSHNSFSDSRMLGRPDAGTINSWPKDVQPATPNARILKRIAELTCAFFDKTLRGMSAPALDPGHAPTKEIQIERFGAAAK